MNKRIEKAEEEYRHAATALAKIVQSEYPLGTRVTVEVGGRVFDAEVTGYGSWWSDPDRLHGVNIVTGKYRHFTANNIRVRR